MPEQTPYEPTLEDVRTLRLQVDWPIPYVKRAIIDANGDLERALYLLGRMSTPMFQRMQEAEDKIKVLEAEIATLKQNAG